MATYLEKMKQNQQQQTPQQGLRGVSQQTQAQLQNYQKPYQQTQQAQAAQQNLQNVQQQKPQSYSSKWSGALDNILQQIQGAGEFKYSLDGDGLFQSYKDMYTQKAKQGAQDTMGVAAGLTGGYGNSWAQSAGAQAYQQNLLPLYDKAMEFAKMAQDRYNADRADKYNQLSALQGMEESDYGRYRDLMSDYNADLDRAREDARYEDETGYGRYKDMLNYWQNQAAAENADYQAGQEMDYRYNSLDEQARQYNESMAENQRQFNASMEQNAQQFVETNKLDWANLEEKQRQFDANLTEEQRQYNQDYAMQLCSAILANGQIPSNELLIAAGLSYEDAQKLIAQETGGGPGGPKKTAAQVGADAMSTIGTLAGLGINQDYEKLAKQAAAVAGTFDEGSEDRKNWQEDAKLYSAASEAMDKARAQHEASTYKGNMTDAEVAAYLKKLEEQKKREQGQKTTVKK